ncbi:pantetheine-phosphate adenylyltransferase [candidate division KSB3 bacterium]|uniref:Phosphopantetheine adenylyltransferase n=1 Tax=candidate division KSB3 bacterium TaxID=2044937 RepID=A0A2G6ECQ3_9BACT|nr:MAG: pantetheine-phosphate adenylyltransferase [candidate division KSB3 bacterium]
MVNKALFAGSFDPPTNGHLNLIRRAAEIFPGLCVLIANNTNKTYLFDADARLAMMKELCREMAHVSVDVYDGLVVQYAKDHDISVLIRGVRNINDFTYEFELARMNKKLSADVDVVFLPADPVHEIVSSSAIKELAMYGVDISTMVPPLVATSLKEKYHKG